MIFPGRKSRDKRRNTARLFGKKISYRTLQTSKNIAKCPKISFIGGYLAESGGLVTW
jgi:hypothetical protein